MSYLLEILGKGLAAEISDLLAPYYWQGLVGEPTQEAPQERLQKRFQEGLEHLRAVELDQAIEKLSACCDEEPAFWRARLALASAYEERGEAGNAFEQLEVADRDHPGLAPVAFAMGFCLEKLGMPKRAADQYRRSIQADETFVPARERLAAVSLLLENPAESVRQYEALRTQMPEKMWVRSALAHLYQRCGRHGESVEEFEMAISMEPENWALMDDEVESLIAEGQLREAIARLLELIDQGSGFPDLHVRLADLYGQTGDDENAMRHYRHALDIQPDYLEATVKVGTQHLVSGRWEEAAESFCQACDLNDHVLANYVGLGTAQAAQGQTGEAMKTFDLAAAVEPNSTLLLSEMARLQLKVAVAEEYARNFDTEVERDQDDPVDPDVENEQIVQRQLRRHAEEIHKHPEHADLRYRYGVLLRSEGRLGDARDQFAKAVDINPCYLKARIKLGITLQELGRVDEAIEQFKQAMELQPTYVDMHYRLGLLYTDRRQFEHAVRHMEAASAGAPGNDQIRANLALSLQNMGLMDQAAATWRSLWRMHHPAET